MTVDDERDSFDDVDGSDDSVGARRADEAARVPGSLFDPDVRELSPDARPRTARARRYLPPPGIGHRRPAEPDPVPERQENKLARRAKLVALLVALALVVASLVIAASLATQGESDGDHAGHPPAEVVGKPGQPA